MMRSETPSDRSRPNDDDIGAELDRVIHSDMFRSSPNLMAFLRFIVEAERSGRGSQIKAYTVAVEALGRDASFDPQANPIVRVEAGRLRRALETYYAGPGANAGIVIEIPRGRYVPTFRQRQVSRGERWAARVRHLAAAKALSVMEWLALRLEWRIRRCRPNAEAN